MTYTYKQRGKLIEETASFAVALRRTQAGWRITGWAYSKKTWNSFHVYPRLREQLVDELSEATAREEWRSVLNERPCVEKPSQLVDGSANLKLSISL